MFAAIWHSSLPRVVPLGMILLAIQKTLFVNIQPFGVIVQVVLAFAASAGVVGGPERGAITGFVLGMIFDLSTGSPLGSTSIAMGVAGYAAGWLDVIRIDTTWWLAAVFVGGASAIGEFLVPVIRRFVGEENAFTPDLTKVVSVVGVSAAALSLVLVPLARWALSIEPPVWKAPRE